MTQKMNRSWSEITHESGQSQGGTGNEKANSLQGWRGVNWGDSIARSPVCSLFLEKLLFLAAIVI